MQIRSFITLLFIITTLTLSAQDIQVLSQIRCGFESSAVQNSSQDLAFENWMDKKRNKTIQRIQEKTGDGVMEIPVIFHVLHYGEEIGTGTNISSEQIQAQIIQANNDLRKKEGTSGFNTYEFGADIGLELLPALFDENGYKLEEAGINRINSIEAGFGSEGTNGYSKSFINTTIKPATQWNPSEYLNVWITDLSSGVLGFAQFPENSDLEGIEVEGNESTDGVVLLYKSVGSTEAPNLSALSTTYENYNKGRTFTHELGHWLGLRHIWGDGGCDTDDFCEDTPRSVEAHYGCPDASTSCNSQDLVENYMDYTNDACMNTFTEDQKIRIVTVMNHSPRRVELLTSDKAVPSTTIDLASFDVRLEEWSAVITWSTLFENNNSLFILYKSTDGVNFNKLAEMDGAGNSNDWMSYEFIDENPSKGTNYYKLALVNFDDAETQIGLKEFEYYLGFKMNINPNPTRGDLDINIWAESEGEAQLCIYDIAGKQKITLVETLEVGRNDLDLDIDHLPHGMYLVQIVQGAWQRCARVYRN